MKFSKEKFDSLLKKHNYIPDDAISMSLYLSTLLKKPLLVEGPAGVGKTEIAKVLAKALNAGLIRLQCYEGLDVNHAIYEWNYSKQLLHLKLLKKKDLSPQQLEGMIYSDEFLLKRPLLQSILSEKPVILLIDEMDRSDEEFESYFLELLSDWQITIPEIGTIKARNIPHVIVTSNRNRELSEALRRRCVYLWIDYPTYEKELEIIFARIPDINKTLANHICLFMQEIRKLNLEKKPGISETLDWAKALVAMHAKHLDRKLVELTLGVVLKDWQDMRESQLSLSELFEKTGIESR